MTEKKAEVQKGAPDGNMEEFGLTTEDIQMRLGKKELENMLLEKEIRRLQAALVDKDKGGKTP